MMIFRTWYGTCLLAFAAWPSLATAAGASGLVVTPASLAARVRAQNPDLAAARLQIREALGRSKQAGRLDNPRLETDVEHDTRFGEGRITFGVTQRFPVTARLRLEKEVSLAGLQAAEAEVREVERKLVAAARESLVRVLAIRQQRTLRREQSEVSGRLASFIADAASKGELSSIDAGQAKLEAARLSTEIRQLDAEEAAAIGGLKPLLGMKPGEALHVSGDLATPAASIDGNNPVHRPDLQAAKIDAKAARTEVELEQAKRIDDFEAGFFAGGERKEDAPEGKSNEGIVGFRFSIPLPLWNDNSGAIEEAEARRERKDKEVVALDRSIRHEADAARAEMTEWAQLVREITTDLLPMADSQAELAEKAYRNGQSEIQAVLRAREQRLQLTASRLDALRDYNLARVRYEAALNRP